MADKSYLSIISHYEACLAEHGDTHLGLDWPVAEDMQTRHRVMLDVIEPDRHSGVIRLLDFGCGTSDLYEYIRRNDIADVDYVGLDISQRFVNVAKSKFPWVEYHCIDVLEQETALPRFDYAVMNGVVTEKFDLTFEEMLDYFKRLVTRVFSLVDHGIAINVMSKHVDWERQDLFHLPFDVLASFLTREVSRNFVFRSDYGLYEYTAYVYR